MTWKARRTRKKARKIIERFDSKDLFRILRDPFLRKSKERTDHGQLIAHLYVGGDYINVQEASEGDSLHCTEDYFKSLRIAVISNIRITLLQDGLHIEQRSNLSISTALANHIMKSRASALKIQDDLRNVFHISTKNMEHRLKIFEDDTPCQTEKDSSRSTSKDRKQDVQVKETCQICSQRTANTQKQKQSPLGESSWYSKMHVLFLLYL